MKNLTIAYDTMQNGEVGEACVHPDGRCTGQQNQGGF